MFVHNSRNLDHDLDLKRGTECIQARLKMASCRQNMMTSSFFQSAATLEQTESRIPDAWSIFLSLSLKMTFCLTKTEN